MDAVCHDGICRRVEICRDRLLRQGTFRDSKYRRRRLNIRGIFARLETIIDDEVLFAFGSMLSMRFHYLQYSSNVRVFTYETSSYRNIDVTMKYVKLEHQRS